MIRRLLGCAALTLAAMVAFAQPASAHAELQESTPGNGERLDAAPTQVLLRFSERVEVALGGVKVFDATGDRVDRGEITHPNGEGSAVAVALPRLPAGAYVVTWRVVSADSHPVQGAFTFAIGDAKSASNDEIAGLLGRGGSRVVGVAYGVGRTIAFAAMLVLLGAVAFVELVWPAGAADRRLRRIAVGALSTLAIATLLNLVLQGGYAAGLGLSDTLSASVVRDVLRTRFGRVYEARLVLLVAAAALAWLLPRRARWWRWAALAVGIGIAATPGLAGHAAIGSNEPYALLSDVVHVGAASVWLGGVVMLLAVALAQPEAGAIARRYSQVAMYAVAVLVATGLFQAWRQVGTIDALRSTEYGKLLIVKTLLVGAILLIAYVSRRTVQRTWDAASPSTLRRTVGVEAAIAVAVLSVTGLLVNAVPARVLAAAPQSGELTSPTLLMDYTVSPARVGSNEIHLYTLTKAGQPQPVVEMTLSLSLADRGIAPIRVELQSAGPGHFRSLHFTVPFRGKWTMNVAARISDVDEEVFAGEVDIR